MNLVDGESKISELMFSNSGIGHMATLTNRRLIVTWKNAEESYPLSKISGVKLHFQRQLGAIVGGVVLGIIGFAILINGSLWGVAVGFVGALMIYGGWIGETQFVITQPGGSKAYKLAGRKPDFEAFVHAINGTLS